MPTIVLLNNYTTLTLKKTKQKNTTGIISFAPVFGYTCAI